MAEIDDISEKRLSTRKKKSTIYKQVRQSHLHHTKSVVMCTTIFTSTNNI